MASRSVSASLAPMANALTIARFSGFLHAKPLSDAVALVTD